MSKMTSTPWNQWIKALKKGDHKSAALIYDATKDSVFRYCVTLAQGNESEAEELAQEAYLKAFKQINQLKEPEKFKNWLILIVRNLWLNKKRTSEFQVQDESLSEMFGEEDNPQSRFDEIAAQTQNSPTEAMEVKEILDQLPPEHREIIFLVDIEGHSHQEVAEILSISEKNSRIRLFRARKKLVEVYDAVTKVGK